MSQFEIGKFDSVYPVLGNMSNENCKNKGKIDVLIFVLSLER